MNMHLQNLLTCFIVLASYKISQHRTAGSPLLHPQSSQVDTELEGTSNSTSYYDGYPQRVQLERHSQYLLGYLRESRALSTINLAMWDKHFDNEQEAREAVDKYLEHKSREVSKGCSASYRLDYNKYRFPATIIVVECNKTRNYCDATQESWSTRGSCVGEQYYLTTLIFRPDTPAPFLQQHTGAQIIGEEGSGELEHNTGDSIDHLTGHWGFHTTIMSRRCLCLAK